MYYNVTDTIWNVFLLNSEKESFIKIDEVWEIPQVKFTNLRF